MTIRKMQKEDYDEVYDIWIHTPGMGLNKLDDSRKGIEKYLKRNPNTCFVAVEADKVIGAILSGHDGRRGLISHTAVRIEYRRQGIGHQLVERGMQGMREEGINKVALVVFSENEIGNEFWEKEGFTMRNDLNYRDKCLAEMEKIQTL